MANGDLKAPYQRVAPPKNIKDVPRYLRQLLGGFFARFAYIVKLVWDTGHWILFLLAFTALFKGVMPVVGALLSKNILNELQTAFGQGAMAENTFWRSTIFYLLIFLFIYQLLLQVVNQVCTALIRLAGEKVVKQVKLQMMEKSKTLDLASFDDPVFYEKLENANREAGNRPVQILSQTFSIISTAIELAGYLAILLAVPGLAWATGAMLVVCAPSAVINYTYRRKNFDYMRRRSKDRRQMNYYSDQLVNKDLVKEVRLFDLGDAFIGRYLSVFKTYYAGLRRLILSESAWHMGLGVAAGTVNLLLYVLIARLVFIGRILIGDYALYTGAIASVASCVATLINTSGLIYEGTLFIDNLIAFMKQPQTVTPRKEPAERVSRNTGHTIEFIDVSFHYPGTDRNVLQNINFTVAPGQTLALVGLNGAGKTTLIKLLTRLYDPTEGKILLDGVDLRNYDLKDLYRTFGIIFQDFGRYAVTVEENIRFGDIRKQADMEAVKAAAAQSTAQDYIEKLPAGYDTPLMRIFETNGTELSTGQWQKLAVARAFYADSEILILDEPTAALDPLAEQEIYRQFDCLRSDKTSIFVSHRLSSTTVADQILVLENGRILEKGSHRELMDRHGRYYELFWAQAKRYVEKTGGQGNGAVS